MPGPIYVEAVDWQECLQQPVRDQRLPSGCLRPIWGEIEWIDGNGTHMSREEYMIKWGIDPQLAWDAIKEFRAKNGGGIKV